MKLIEALELAEACGLKTVGDAIFNVDLHAGQLFAYTKIKEECDEMINEWLAVKNGNSKFNLDTPIHDVMGWLNTKQED